MESKTWVVLVTDLFGAVGGIAAFNRELIDALQAIAWERQWTLKVYALNDRLASPGAARGPLPYEYRAYRGNRWRFVWDSFRAALQADRVIVGHVHISPLACVIPRGRCWMIAHGIEVWNSLSWPRRLGIRRMARILSVSRFTGDRLVERHHVKAESIVIFPNTARFSPAGVPGLPELANLGAFKMIFTLSRLWPQERYKKIDRVIEALPSVLRAIPDALYVIAGEGGDRRRLEELARDLGVSKRVIFTGSLPDDRVRSYYEACDVFILPSLGEGFGIVFLEAMACGKPCVGADAGAIPEVIQNGRTGLLAKPDSAASTAEALIQLLQNDPLRRAMGQAGRERYLSEFAFEHFKGRLARLTEQAV